MYIWVIASAVVIFVIILIFFKLKPSSSKNDIFDTLDEILQNDEDVNEDEDAKKIMAKYKLNDSVILELKQLYNTKDEVTEKDYNEILNKYI